MKIRFERTGGFAGMMIDAEVDATSLPESETQTLKKLVADSCFFALPSRVRDSCPRGADCFHYRIAIESGDQYHMVETSEEAAPESLRPLLEWLSTEARRAR